MADAAGAGAARTEAPQETLLSLAPDALAERVVALGGKAFHAKIAREQVLRHGHTSFDPITSLPAGLRDALAAELPVLSSREVSRSVSRDRTTKLLLGFPRAGTEEATVETVFIPPSSPSSKKGATLCVSTQVGCPVACPFCASGRLGLVRNLAAHEILEQYVRGRALGELSRSVVMGIGEPFLNLANLRVALDAVTDEMGIGARRITVSTVGFPDRVRRAAEQNPRFQLAISLHTPFDEQRDELVPAMAGTPIDEVLAAADRWFEVTGREVTYEYVVLGGHTDTADHARRLAERLRGRRCTVNLIPYNPVHGDAYRRPLPEAVEAFRADLERAGIVATVRWSRGLDGDAACGQLRVRSAAV